MLGKPTTDRLAALAAMPVQRRVSLACVLLANATLKLAPAARNPVALATSIAAADPVNAPPTPTKRFTPVKSIVSRSALTVSPAVAATETVLLATTKAPLAST